MKIFKPALSLTAMSLLLSTSAVNAQKTLGLEDVFHFNQAKSVQLSEDGKTLALSSTPYRGDAKGMVYDLQSNKKLLEVAQGAKTVINKKGNWVAITVSPSLLAKESASKKEKEKLKNALTLFNPQTLAQKSFEKVKDFTLSDDGQWLAYRIDSKVKEDKKKTDSDVDKADNSEKKKVLKADKKDKTYSLVVVNLTNDSQQTFDKVYGYSLSSNGQYLAISQFFENMAENQIAIIELAKPSNTHVLEQAEGLYANQLVWSPSESILAYSFGAYTEKDQRRRSHQLKMWQSKSNTSGLIELPKQNWFIGKTAKLKWSEHGQRLYFETRPELAKKEVELKVKKQADLFDFNTIRQQKKLALWHPEDDYTKPREKVLWDKENKNRHYQAVYHLEGEKVSQLASPEMAGLNFHSEKTHLLGFDNSPYVKQVNYQGRYADFYSVNVTSGEQHLIVKNFSSRPTLSPNGQYAAYFQDNSLFLKNLTTDKVSKIVSPSNMRFSDDQHDYPSQNSGYGFAGWADDDSGLYVYSKYDIWHFDTKSHKSQRLTTGEHTDTRYRVKHLDKNKLGFKSDDVLVVSATHLTNKQTEIATLNLADNSINKVLIGDAKFSLVKKAKQADKLVFTKQDFHTYPDFWQTDSNFTEPKQVTELNPQIADFAWSQKPELIQYKGYDGEDLQGTLIKPAGYKEGDKVPVVIYFYRYMTPRHFDFPRMELNHRPNLPVFTSNGYAIFLPDIRFEIGHPGKSSTKTMMNAAQKLIDLGIAHPDKIGLQGHSWAGYQSAFMITQTDMFKAVVSGAPVSNMTSAYGGIRLKSGLTRQFQYETGQSRIGKDLFDGFDLYIENSPLFFADKVNTPILIMFGDRDDAVPWDEGVQYYLALRRAGKDAMFLQYHDEPHHLKKLPNQLDFSIRMLEYFDHHLKGKAAAPWMKDGEAYIKED